MSSSSDMCIFCKIVRKDAHCSCVYEDDVVMAFLDIKPLNEGHTLVIPKKHYEYVYDVPDQEVAHLYKIVKKVACAIKKGVKAEGISIMQHNERAAGQYVFHVHVHVLPRYEGQILPRHKEARELPEASKTKLDEVAKKIRQCI